MKKPGLKYYFVSTLVILAVFLVTPGVVADAYLKARKALIQKIEQDVIETRMYIGKTAFDERVMQAMEKVPRHEFVPIRHRDSAYRNQPLPIGHGQTISQPYIVALMTDLMELKSSDKALEVGTGSGYQAAIMAELADQVYSIEIIEPLAERAASLLGELGYRNITTRSGDGYYGWEEQAPFDVIVVTAASGHIPPPLIEQLKPGGRMVIPVGSRFMVQQLVLVKKDQAGKVTTRQILPVRFVPLTGDHD